jgi:pyridoxine 4-dehydrogenase
MTVTADAAGTWKLGDKVINRLGFGAMRLPQLGRAFDVEAPPRDRDEAVKVLRRAVELGVNHIDTAAFYFSRLRSANELINRALTPYADDLVIVTKVGPSRDASGRWVRGVRPDQLRGQVEENLRQLGTDSLHVVNLRIADGTGSIAELFGALADLRTGGLVEHLGVSNVEPHHLAEAQAIAPVVCVQNMYGLGVRAEQAEFVRACGDQGVAFVPFFSLAGARGSAGPTDAAPAAVQEIAERHGVTAPQVQLAWTLHQGAHVLAIPGTGDPAHLEANVAAAAIALTPEDRAVLDTVHQAA